MQALPGGALVPTSQEGGNMVADNSPAMAAPGSQPVTPMPYGPGATAGLPGAGGGGDGTGDSGGPGGLSAVAGENLPLPNFGKLPGKQIPVSTQPGKYGGKGLPAPPANLTSDLRVPGITGPPQGAGSGGITQPSKDGGGFTTGNQPGGNQGAGNSGAGDSGTGSLWKATPGFRAPAWGASSTNS
jgi:hypothetical protein